MKKILYISYDGMTDPLGQSQVINYLIGLSKLGFRFDILSFEKPDKFEKLGPHIKNLLDKNNIRWYPQVFHTQPPVISKIIDRNNLFSTAKKLHKHNKYDLIHCRSYTAAEAGLKLKKHTGVKFLFDMRGFWADEKADGGSWNRKKIFWNGVYKFYKKKEKDFITQADHIISLTHAAKNEMVSWPFYNSKVPISVIPCCTDTTHFELTSKEKKQASRKLLGIPDNVFTVSYLGSLGTWYMIDEMLALFKSVKEVKPDAIFLILTNSNLTTVEQKLQQMQLKKTDFKILNVPFTEVPSRMYASDVSLSFIRPVYSKMSSSPVKIGEILSMGIPIIANDIGDSGQLIQKNNVGFMLKQFSEPDLKYIAQKIDDLKLIEPTTIREVAKREFSLDKGVMLYAEVYKQFF